MGIEFPDILQRRRGRKHNKNNHFAVLGVDPIAMHLSALAERLSQQTTNGTFVEDATHYSPVHVHSYSIHTLAIYVYVHNRTTSTLSKHGNTLERIERRQTHTSRCGLPKLRVLFAEPSRIASITAHPISTPDRATTSVHIRRVATLYMYIRMYVCICCRISCAGFYWCSHDVCVFRAARPVLSCPAVQSLCLCVWCLCDAHIEW